jgi:Zn-finger protein
MPEINDNNYRLNKACKFYPCHKNLEDCTFCYCPFYACENLKRGRYISRYIINLNNNNNNPIWDCSNCEWIHKKSTVDKIFEELRQIELLRDDRVE